MTVPTKVAPPVADASPQAGPAVAGIGLMSLATLMFAANDTLLKLAIEGIPPIAGMFYRGLAAVLWSLPALMVLRHAPRLRLMFNPWVLARNTLHLGAVFCFMLAVRHLPLGDLVALGQLAPALVIVGAAAFYRERMGLLRIVFVSLSLLGAMLLAQPGAGGLSPFVLLGLASALLSAMRDLIGGRIPNEIPVLLVVISNLWFEVIGSGIVITATAGWFIPSVDELSLIAGAGLLLVVGHSLFFLSYRVGGIGKVAPFFYLYPVWSFFSGVFVFGDRVTMVGLAGISLILAGGVAIALTRQRGVRSPSLPEPVAVEPANDSDLPRAARMRGKPLLDKD